jgi:3-dehydroshikimate dehydratase
LSIPGLEHASFVGSRGRGVTPAATLPHICPQNGIACQPPPNAGLRAPTLTDARLEDNTLHVVGTVVAPPTSRYVVELFGNSDSESPEAEVFLVDRAVYTDQEGKATFALEVERLVGDRRLSSLTATLTSTDGATSPLSGARAIRTSTSRGRPSSRR